MNDDYTKIRLSHEGLLDLQRVLGEARKERLSQITEEQNHLINALNRTDQTALLLDIKQKLEESNTALRILATQTNKLLDAINAQTTAITKLLENQQK